MNSPVRFPLRPLAFLGLCSVLPMVAQPPSPPTLVVLPSAQQTTDGTASLNYPWDLTTATGATSLRYQQVYNASDFGGNSGTISQIGFRVAASAGSGVAFNPISIPSVTIVLSTTAKTADGLSKTFSSNTGTHAVTVYSGPLMLSSSDTVPPGTNAAAAFDTRVYLKTPYTYNPASGNLLMDLKINTNSSVGVTTSPFDAENATDSVSRVYATSSSATTATVSDSKGVVTQFMFGDTTPTIGSGIGWFLVTSNFNNIYAASANVASANFNNSQTYILSDNSTTGSTVTSVPAGWSAIGGIDFKSFADLQTAVQSGWVGGASASANLEALSYDNEDWSFTPSTEQKNAARYEALFANLAHAYGYTFFPTPALDIMNVQTGDSGPSWIAYLNLDCPPTSGQTFPVFSTSAPADIYELQSQSLESGIDVTNYSASDYNVFLTSATNQALGVNSKVIVFAGLNANSAGGGPVTPDQLYESVVDSASAGISGYWLNTSSADAAASVELLQRLDSVNVTSDASVTLGTLTLVGSYYEGTVTVQNTSSGTINGPIQVIFQGLNCTLENAGGTFNGNPYYTASGSSLGSGNSVQFTAEFNSATPSYTAAVYSGTF